MKSPDFSKSYLQKTAELLAAQPEDIAMSQAIGAEFDAMGTLEFQLLKEAGLQPQNSLIDVGCGSGRLAVKLKDYLTGEYIGIDVVPDLFQYASRLCGRSDWRFYIAPGTNIPEPDASADFIVFFSVFTHLLHEETYRYLEDCSRVLKPGGKIVFSFLEFAIPSHWAVFNSSVLDTRPDKVLNQFIDRDMVKGFASKLGLHVESIHDGDKPHIRLDSSVTFDDGRTMTGMGNLGQSVCVLSKT
jgi:ubiquinone/menaquinone biosynthesis C-methylase UbiE